MKNFEKHVSKFLYIDKNGKMGGKKKHGERKEKNSKSMVTGFSRAHEGLGFNRILKYFYKIFFIESK
jgi:hypothetical protein